MWSAKPIYPPKGFLFSGIIAGIKKKHKNDLGLILSQKPASASAVFTTNVFLAAPVLISKQRIKAGTAQAILVNSGNANAGLGNEGIVSAKKTSKALAQKLGIKESMILLASTGVIGEKFPAEKIKNAIPKLVQNLNPDGVLEFTRAIMTTDTREKISSRKIQIQGKDVRILGIAKGAGMIQPKMATMLGFLMTDAEASPDTLNQLLKQIVPHTFNRITIDGDTSTNDSLFLLANGASKVKIAPDKPGWNSFRNALYQICLELATMMVADGEGVTRYFYVQVNGAKSKSDAEKIARQIANSPLLKTAISASDPNWGRIIAAAGIAGVKFNPNHASVFLLSPNGKNRMEIFKHGARSKKYQGLKQEKRASKILSKNGFKIIFHLESGKESFEMISCDLTEQYVRINASYRT